MRKSIFAHVGNNCLHSLKFYAFLFVVHRRVFLLLRRIQYRTINIIKLKFRAQTKWNACVSVYLWSAHGQHICSGQFICGLVAMCCILNNQIIQCDLIILDKCVAQMQTFHYYKIIDFQLVNFVTYPDPHTWTQIQANKESNENI